MKAGWQTEKLGEVCSMLNRGISPKYLESGGVCVVNQKCIRDHRVSYEQSRRHDSDAKAVNADRFIKPGDVLVNSTGTGTLGRVAQVREAPPEPTTVDSHVTIVRPKPGKFFPEFFGYMLVMIEEEIQEAGEGCGGQTELARSVLAEKFTVSYPESLPEQQRIVAILDEAFDGIATARANTEKNLQNARALFESHLQSIFTQRGNGWVERPIGELCQRLHQGLNTAGEKIKFFQAGYPIIQTRNIGEGSVDLDNKIKYMSEADWLLYKDKYRPEVGDVFFTNIGTIGKTAIVTEERDFLIHWNIFKLRPNFELVSPEYLRYALEQLTLAGYFKKMQKGGTVEFVTKKMISEALLCLPGIKMQEAIVYQLDEVRAETQRLESLYQRKLAALDELKKSLLHKAFSGEL